MKETTQSVQNYKFCNMWQGKSQIILLIAFTLVLVTSLPSKSKTINCPIGFTKCPNQEKCILYEQVCDGHPDCLIGEDELGDSTRCCEFGFKCPGRCLPTNRVCDGWYDCSDQSDEHQNCTGPAPTTCSGFFC